MRNGRIPAPCLATCPLPTLVVFTGHNISPPRRTACPQAEMRGGRRGTRQPVPSVLQPRESPSTRREHARCHDEGWRAGRALVCAEACHGTMEVVVAE
jgi:hypothetical protein